MSLRGLQASPGIQVQTPVAAVGSCLRGGKVCLALSSWYLGRVLVLTYFYQLGPSVASLCMGFRLVSGFLGFIPQGGSVKQATLLSTNSEVEGTVYW